MSQAPDPAQKLSQQAVSLLILVGAVTAAFFLSGIVYEYVMVSTINHHAYIDDNALHVVKELKTKLKIVDRAVATIFGLIVMGIVVYLAPKKDISLSGLIWKCVFIDLIFLVVFGLVRFYFFSAQLQRAVFEIQTANSLRPGQAYSVFNSDKYLFDFWGAGIYGVAAIAIWWLLSMARCKD